MGEKHPVWTRTRVGRDRVHWVAYDDVAGAEGRITIAQGYAPSLKEADVAAREALAEAGIYGSRRASTASRRVAPPKRDNPAPAAGASGGREPRREYLYTRRAGDHEGETFVAAHLVLSKTAKKVRVGRRSCGPDQIGTEDEDWEGLNPTVALDRARLEREGSAYSVGYPDSEFYTTRARAMGDTGSDARPAFRALGLEPPCSLDDIKAAYRIRALSVHPDRGGNPAEFHAVEAAYRRLLREAAPDEPPTR
ncbi:J domain-containing protein [Tundrisphaera sp. TA3]|uniref:J domain-containing protein n=1 Tax=Tundrisphaera sp. TA3 TaxID=3435775 RepID=UPI003EBECADB